MRYFQDDDNVGLKEMVRREKMSSAQDQNALYSRMAAKVRGNARASFATCTALFVEPLPPPAGRHWCSLHRVFTQQWQVTGTAVQKKASADITGGLVTGLQTTSCNQRVRVGGVNCWGRARLMDK